jgi:lysozyme
MAATAQNSTRAGMNLIMQSEGCECTAYQDAVGVWTIGYGETNGVSPGMTITQAQAVAMLQSRYDIVQNSVLNLVKVPLSQNQLGALVSFAYNVGVGNLASSTLLRLLNAGQNPQVVAQQFARWNLAGGKVLPGLVTRRANEANLFLTPDPVPAPGAAWN